MSLFNTGVRPAIDQRLLEQSEEVRDYGDYWSASSAGYCMRLSVMRRLKVPPVPEILEGRARQQRVFTSGHIFHEWIQGITKQTGLSIAQELELQDEDLMIRGHIDDLVLVSSGKYTVGGITHEDVVDAWTNENSNLSDREITATPKQHLILYDYKTQNSRAFTYQKGRPMSHFHKMQLATYMYMLRKTDEAKIHKPIPGAAIWDVKEARILKISKDDLRMSEEQLLWTDELQTEVLDYWRTLNKYWVDKKMPPCTCLKQEGGFMGKRTKAGKVYNDFFWNNSSCSLEWYEKCKKEGLIHGTN